VLWLSAILAALTCLYGLVKGVIAAGFKRVVTIITALSFLATNSLWAAESVYIVADHLGTPQVMTDKTMQEVWRADYDPFGRANVVVNTINSQVRFQGQYHDIESGLHYNYFRYYNPNIGSYMQADPTGIRGGLNIYSYAGGDPVHYVDPNGLSRIGGLFKGGLVGAIVGGVISGGIAALSGCGIGGILEAAIKGALFGLALTPIMNLAIKGIMAIPGIANVIRGMAGAAGGVGAGVTQSIDDVGVAGIAAINKSMGGLADGTPMLGKSVSTVLANATYREGSVSKAASAIRDIAGGHLFKDGNKRTAQALTESLNLPGVSSAQIRNAVTGAGNGTIKSVDDIAKALGGG